MCIKKVCCLCLVNWDIGFTILTNSMEIEMSRLQDIRPGFISYYIPHHLKIYHSVALKVNQKKHGKSSFTLILI